MRMSIVSIPVRLTIALLISALLAAGCSSSSDSQTPIISDIFETDDTDATGNDGTSTGEGELDDDSTDGTTQPPAAPGTPITPDDNPVVTDPLVQNSTRVDFDITVPAYASDALQVRVIWGDRDMTAQWVGDEIWSASDEFPTNTENRLTVTFYDQNGEITLGSFEADFTTGTNASESFQINADQFDTDQWDNDNDGVSNIDELVAGTYTSGAPRVLLFSETRDFRHSSIEDAVLALQELGSSADIETDLAADSAGLFTETNLANYDAVVWVLTSGDVLDADEQTAFENYIRSGGGFAGIHAASDTEYDWPWYGALVGAYFERHPLVQSASQNVEDGSHPSTAHLGSTWTRTDEWYDYRSNPRAQVNVLLTLDEDSYSGGEMGDDHPSAWYHDYDGGRSWYTGGGHTDTSYSEPDFRAHLLGGLRYAAGVAD
ncbi:ThuA domain-containing protein [Granulosicoccus antarcticus]|uniref:ThuA-like domain-containing protein n=1 Tax=Granulosicoccus antarcticus IMCC3135 TaxID=1192854 RepID=A0A2Z2P1K0_9GAMM|nr:ThuA domain-containing protein [Granulosicoccus antarcticus]ASJ76705.1 hypothetical protein IMCC3135_33305 [Granulosicoccus antarcticus IMCC3135]